MINSTISLFYFWDLKEIEPIINKTTCNIYNVQSVRVNLVQCAYFLSKFLGARHVYVFLSTL